MKQEFFKDQVSFLKGQNDRFFKIISGLLILIFAMFFFMMHLVKNEKVIVTPPIVEQGFWVTNNAVSPTYLTQMTTFFLALRLSVTSSNVDSQYAELLNYVSPSVSGPLQVALQKEAEQIQSEAISSVFYPKDMTADPDHLTVTVDGDLVRYVGEAKLPVKPMTYIVHYEYRLGRLLILSFEQVEKK
jgi:conjugal transfer pilus assembly protein TraE